MENASQEAHSSAKLQARSLIVFCENNIFIVTIQGFV